MKVKPGKVFPPTKFETIDNRDRTCFHELHIIELDVERFRVERICNSCLCTLEKKSYPSLKELLLDIHAFVDSAIGKVYVVSESSGLTPRAPDAAIACPNCGYLAKYPICTKCGHAIPAAPVM